MPMPKVSSETSERSVQTFVRIRKKAIVILTAILLTVALLGGAFAIYVGNYYRANAQAIEAFSPAGEIEESSLDDGTLVFRPPDALSAFIFYPGGRVDYTAYIPLMRELASGRVLCLLVKMPFNLAVFDINAADGYREMFPEIEQWFIGGHSLGGAMAASFISGHTEQFSGLVLLGAYSTADLSTSGTAVLSVYGSLDGVMNRQKYEKYKKNLPKDAEEYIIQGGCHAGFGMYGVQKGDGTPTVSSQEQIRMTAEYIVSMIRSAEDFERNLMP